MSAARIAPSIDLVVPTPRDAPNDRDRDLPAHRMNPSTILVHCEQCPCISASPLLALRLITAVALQTTSIWRDRIYLDMSLLDDNYAAA
jgi:hypothetical protein